MRRAGDVRESAGSHRLGSVLRAADCVFQRACQPTDAASLAAFRMAMGLLGFISAIRFLAYGWVERFYVQPSRHLDYPGFAWVDPLPGWGMHAVFVALAGLALCIAAGFLYRIAVAAFFILFAYVQLIDVALYLNHYYLVVLLAGLMALMPLHRMGSVDAWRKPELRAGTVPAWNLWLLRFQVGVVYVYAGLAKVGSDWLLHGQPLGIWMSARTGTPLVGPWLGEPWVAVAMSWAGMLNDLLAVPLLMWRRTRPFGYGMVVVFHLLTGYFFDIGMFPYIMIAAATVFFDPGWPRKLVPRRWLPPPVATDAATGRAGWPQWAAGFAVVAFALFQVLMPLRAHLYGGDVLWHEQGMRWSWRVMLREKQGSLTYVVKTDRWPNGKRMAPHRYLTRNQERELATRPDLIHQVALDLERRLEHRGHDDVEVRADVRVSLNGRPARRLVDPEVDLTAVDEGLGREAWILPAPRQPPLRLEPSSSPVASHER